MSEYIEFAQTNPLLVFGFIAVLGIIIWTEIGRLNQNFKQLNANQAVQLINDDNTICIDVREDKEITTGGIKGAIHIPSGQISSRMSELDKYKNNPILVYCRSGSRSASICKQLDKAGFENLANLSGGIIAWETAKLPIVSI